MFTTPYFGFWAKALFWLLILQSATKTRLFLHCRAIDLPINGTASMDIIGLLLGQA